MCWTGISHQYVGGGARRLPDTPETTTGRSARREGGEAKGAEGKHRKGTPANGPLCDLNKACLCRKSGFDGAVHEKAMDCFSGPAMGSMSSSHCKCSGRTPRSQLFPERCMEPGSCQMFTTSADLGQVEGRVLSMGGVHSASAHGGVPLLDQLDQKAGLESSVAPETMATWPDPKRCWQEPPPGDS